MSLDHCSTCSSTASMPPPENPEQTRWKNIKMLEPPFRSVHTYVNDGNEDSSASAKVLNREGGEDGNDGIHPKMEQSETAVRAKRKFRVNIVAQSYTEINLIVAAKVEAQESSSLPMKSKRSWPTFSTTICNPCMTRHVQELVLSFIKSLNKY